MIGPAEAKKRLETVRKALKHLCDIHPTALRSYELISGPPKSWCYKTVQSLHRLGYIQILELGPVITYFAVMSKIREILDDDQKLSEILWPRGVVAFPKQQRELALESPPAIEGVKKPPAGSSPEVVFEWVFTLLHAQTENLIYIRERVDKLLEAWS